MILLVGDKPSPKMKPGANPFEGASCEKLLMEWVSFIKGDFEVGIINQFDHDMIELYNYGIKGCKFVALGNIASDRLFLLDIPHFKLPHPSGRNRQINDKEFIAKKLEECREWLKNQK